MRKQKVFFLSILAIVCLTSLLLALPRGKRCNGSGVWSGAYEVAPNVFWYFTFTASQEASIPKRSVVVLKWLNDDPSLGGSFPADYRSDFVGERIRIGKNTWKATLVAHAGNKATGELVYIMIYNEIETLTNNCNTVTADGVWAIYFPFQDVNPVDGFPDDDQIDYPIASGTYSAEGNRVPVLN